MKFELQEDTPGSQLTSEEVGWTPVMKYRIKKMGAVKPDACVASKLDSGSSDDGDLSSLYKAGSVLYRDCDSVAGLTFRHGCTSQNVSLIPVVPSPTAKRTRPGAKTKFWMRS